MKTNFIPDFKTKDGEVIDNLLQVGDLPDCTRNTIEESFGPEVTNQDDFYFGYLNEKMIVIIVDGNKKENWLIHEWVAPEKEPTNFSWKRSNTSVSVIA